MKISRLIEVLEQNKEIYGDITVHIDLDVGDDVVPIHRTEYNSYVDARNNGLQANILILQGAQQ